MILTTPACGDGIIEESQEDNPLGPKPKEDESPMTNSDHITQDRFWAKVDIRGTNDCWPWTAAVNGPKGYGYFARANSRRKYLAHRVVWEMENGPIPRGM